jgi:hypothetical protein
MQENRTSQAGYGWVIIVSQYHDNVIDMIFSKHGFGGSWIGQANRTIVGRIFGRITPAIIGQDGSARQLGFWTLHPIGSIENPAQGIAAGWGCSVTFALVSSRTKAARANDHIALATRPEKLTRLVQV